MHVHFYDDLDLEPKSREEVRLKELGLFVYEGGRRVAIGFNLTPFLERPSILVTILNGEGQEAASLSVIEAIDSRFNLTAHLRDREIVDPYRIEAIVYYLAENGERQISDSIVRTFDSSRPGTK